MMAWRFEVVGRYLIYKTLKEKSEEANMIGWTRVIEQWIDEPIIACLIIGSMAQNNCSIDTKAHAQKYTTEYATN